MRSIRIALPVLVLIMAAGLVNGCCLSHRCADWVARLDAAVTAAESGNWESAAQDMTELADSWQQHQVYLCITLPHDVIDETDTLLYTCAALVDTQDMQQLATAAVQLRLQFGRLAETEQLSLKNIL